MLAAAAKQKKWAAEWNEIDIIEMLRLTHENDLPALRSALLAMKKSDGCGVWDGANDGKDKEMDVQSSW